MTDREFLWWIHQRLVKVHGESEWYDYMWRLRAVIERTPKGQQTSASDNVDMLALEREFGL